jgi:hypothetical protein
MTQSGTAQAEMAHFSGTPMVLLMPEKPGSAALSSQVALVPNSLAKSCHFVPNHCTLISP